MTATTDNSPIFVGGLMKSGTTLVRKLLSRHPRIFGGLETHWFTPPIREQWRDVDSTRQRWLAEFFHVSREEMVSLTEESSSGIEFFNRFMDFCTARAGRARWVEKTPDNIVHCDLILQHWPDARILHVVRDYRDIFASWKRNQKGSLEEFVAKAQTVIALTAPLADRPDQFRRLSYEELVSDPENALRGVVSWLNEEWVPGLEEYGGDDSDYEQLLAVTGKASPTAESLRKPIFQGSVGQWRETLTPEEAAFIERSLPASDRSG